MQFLILMIKGFFIGVANIIPGVSGGTLAITLGIYEQLINAISHFFSDLKNNIKLLLPLGIGAVISIALLAKVLSFCLDNYSWATILFFLGLILGGLPMLWKKVKDDKKKVSNWIIFIIIFAFVASLAFIKTGDTNISLAGLDLLGYIKLFGVGVLAAATMVIPGISGSFVLMLIGYYKPIIDKISSFFEFNNFIGDAFTLGVFGIGVLIGIVLVAKLLEFLFEKYKGQTYFAVLGFVLSSVVGIIMPILGNKTSVMEIIIGIVLFIIGGTIAYKLGDD